jgi:hypothetical protein
MVQDANWHRDALVDLLLDCVVVAVRGKAGIDA